MIRNGVIDVRKEFAERRNRVDAARDFDRIKAEIMDNHGVDIECCRETYFKAAEQIFAFVGEVLVDMAHSKPHRSKS